MAVDKLVDSTQLDSDLTDVADEIRTAGGTLLPLSFPDDYVVAIGDIGNTEIKTASGSIAHFEDALARKAQNLTVAIEPVQSGSGDPSPDNVRPISGWTGANVTRTGKNLFDKNASDLQVGYAIDPNTFVIYQTGSGNYNLSGYVPIKGGQNYILSGSSKNCDIVFYDSNKTAISGRSTSGQVTAPDNAVYCRFDYWKADHDSIQLELGSTATAYEPYNADTYSITFPSEAGTVYGGTLDVTTGKLTVDRISQIVDQDSAVNRLDDDRCWISIDSNSYTNTDMTQADGHIISDKFRNVSNNATATSPGIPGVLIRANGSHQAIISARGLGLNLLSPADWKAWLSNNPVQLCYELATPIVYDLTPTEVTTLLGTNNVWADTGDSTIQYIAPKAQIPSAQGVYF